MAPEKDKAKHEARIRRLVDGWAKALRCEDINGIMSIYEQDVF